MFFDDVGEILPRIRGRHLKSLILYSGNFLMPELEEVLLEHADCLEDLTLRNVLVHELPVKPLPKLRSIKLENCYGNLDKLLMDCTYLEELTVWGRNPDRKISISTPNFRLSYLEKLKVDDCVALSEREAKILRSKLQKT